MVEILGLDSGVFFVEFYWTKADARDYHAVAVNCGQRRIFCNTLGVVPFSAGKNHRSEKTHEAAVAHFHIRNVYRVYRFVEATNA